VAIVADATHAEDARYVEAALRAAAEVTGLEADLVRLAEWSELTGDTGDAAEWIVLLQRASPPPAVLDRVRAGAVLFTATSLTESYTLTRFASATVHRDAACGGDGAPVWNDDAGVPLLTVSALGRGRWYRFCSRWHPSGGDLVLHAEFPEALAVLWADTRDLPLRPAPVPVSPAQAQPARAGSRRAAVPAGAWDLTLPLWALAAALFALERALARRREPLA
jgi:hypothetical protein